jgi:hypothetical protein
VGGLNFVRYENKMQTSSARQIGTFLFLTALAAITSRAAADAGLTAPARIAECRIGFDGRYKVGHWSPIRIAMDPDTTRPEISVEVVVSDSDGIPTTTTAKVDELNEALLYVRVGQVGSPIHVRLLSEDEVIDEIVLRPGVAPDRVVKPAELPATGELLLALGSTPFGLAEAFADRPAGGGLPARRTVQLTDINDLPTDWIGYDGVDVLIISAGDGELCRKFAADQARFDAVRKWIELGGRLVLFCGGRDSESLLAAGGPLAPFVPGRFVAAVALLESASLERYAESDMTILSRTSRAGLRVAQVAEVDGQVELFGTGAAQLPLVIRSPRGLGEIAFVGLDLDEPPLSAWSGRRSLVRAVLRPLTASPEPHELPRNLVTSGYDDLSGALRQRLGQSFAGVRPITFSTVISLAFLYLLFLGPADYLLVQKWIRRPWAAWITFPFILVLFVAGTLLLERSRGPMKIPSTNQVEVIDVDGMTGRARGTFWSMLYSPQARRYDLEFAARIVPGRTPQGCESHFSWLGLAGSGIGGMTAGATDFVIDAAGYRFDATHALTGVPVLTAATKSFTARWDSKTDALIAARLRDDQGRVIGSITNQAGTAFRNVRLFYGTWAYRLKDLETGATLTVDERLSPISIQALITGQSAESAGERSSLFVERASTPELLHAMMFYQAAGGARFARFPLRYQSYCDLSRQIALGRAVLVAEASTAGSSLVERDSGQWLGSGKFATNLVVYRFVIPVSKSVE